MTPAKRKRLQQCFEHASKQAGQNNYDYATELFTQCLLGDPGNAMYLHSFLGNLQKKYSNNKKGSKLALFKGAGPRGSVKKARMQKDWENVLNYGLEVLKINPWEVSTLMAMAEAAEELDLEEVPLIYLKCALDAKPKDPDVNRQCAVALRKRGQFDQAIACWHRVEQALPDDEEAKKTIADLAVEKTIAQAGYDSADSSQQVRTGGQTGAGGADPETPEAKLERAIKRDPENLDNYMQLAQIYLSNEHYDKAIKVLEKAVEVSDGDVDVRERLEDAELRHLRKQLAAAERDVKNTGGEDAQKQYNRLRQKLNLKELEVYKNRVERYPNNLAFKYDLGLRYQLAGEYNEAIQQFQLARNDPRRKGLCMLALGQCFQQIKQYRLAMSHYSTAIEEIPDRDAENKKKALYLAGKLSLDLRDLDVAEKYLTTLAGLDFAYRDVSALLDKIAQLREDGED
jgi:tetratricopeptide (TPR) repeat protein